MEHVPDLHSQYLAIYSGGFNCKVAGSHLSSRRKLSKQHQGNKNLAGNKCQKHNGGTKGLVDTQCSVQICLMATIRLAHIYGTSWLTFGCSNLYKL